MMHEDDKPQGVDGAAGESEDSVDGKNGRLTKSDAQRIRETNALFADDEEETAADVLQSFKNATGLRQLDLDINAYLRNEPTGERKRDYMRYSQWRVAHMVEDYKSKVLFITLVCVNAILIGVQADYETPENEKKWAYVEAAFVTIFVFEIGLKLFGFGHLFFVDGWNVMDLLIVAVSAVEVIGTLSSDQESSGLSAFRLLRVLRVTRLLGFLERLNLLVRAFLLALQDIVWVLVLVVILLYIFAILAQGFFGDSSHLQAAGFDAYGHFGTVPRSMATLFQMMTMDSWMSAITRPVGNVHMGAFFFFIFFVGMASLGMLNLLTAIFVESLSSLTKEGALEEQERLRTQKNRMINFIKKAFKEFDVNGDNSLDQEEIQVALQKFETPEYKEALKIVGLDLESIRGAIAYADISGDGKVEIEEFCHGIESLSDEPKKRDTWEILSKVVRLDRQIMDKLDMVGRQLDVLLAHQGLTVPEMA